MNTIEIVTLAVVLTIFVVGGGIGLTMLARVRGYDWSKRASELQHELDKARQTINDLEGANRRLCKQMDEEWDKSAKEREKRGELLDVQEAQRREIGRLSREITRLNDLLGSECVDEVTDG